MDGVLLALLLGLASYAIFGFTLLYLWRQSEQRIIQTIVAHLKPRQPGHRRAGVIIPLPYAGDDLETLRDEG